MISIKSIRAWFRRMWFEAFCDCDHMGSDRGGHKLSCRTIRLWGKG